MRGAAFASISLYVWRSRPVNAYVRSYCGVSNRSKFAVRGWRCLVLFDDATHLEDRIHNRALVRSQLAEHFVEDMPTDEAIAGLRFQVIEGRIGHRLGHVHIERAGGEIPRDQWWESPIERGHGVSGTPDRGHPLDRELLTLQLHVRLERGDLDVVQAQLRGDTRKFCRK